MNRLSNKRVILLGAAVLAVVIIVTAGVGYYINGFDRGADDVGPVSVPTGDTLDLELARVPLIKTAYDAGILSAGLPSRQGGEFCWAYDVFDPNVQAGYADYVFVGKIVSYEGTTYPGGGVDLEIPIVGEPFTHYSVQVIQNLLGELVKDQLIPLQKYGGVWQDKKSYFLCDKDDFLPAPGDICVFYANTEQGTGGLNLGGPADNKLIAAAGQEVTEKLIYNSEVYKEAIIAVAGRRLSENGLQPRWGVSDYDVSRQKG